MTGSLRSLQSILLSVLVLLIGHGLQLTLLPLKARALDWSNGAIGLTGSAYYLGFIVGCLTIPGLVRRVGHIRAFSLGVAIAAISVLLASVLLDLVSWMVLRFFTGATFAGLYMVVESWLNERSSNQQRGSILALYTTISLGAMALGQLFVEVDSLSLDMLFPLAGVLLIAATLPIGSTSQPQPAPPVDIHFSWSFIYSASHVGVVCAGLSGVVNGLIWTLGAVFAADIAGNIEAGARFVLFAILGGFLTQFPAGRLSDRVDRRWVILILGIIGLSGGVLMMFIGAPNNALLYLSAFLCGAGAMPMYSICVAHANDNADGRFMQIASGMLVANALGAVAGPLFYGVMQKSGVNNGFMLAICIAFGACICWTILRMRTHAVTREFFEPYQPLPETGVEVAILDPRMDAIEAPEAESDAQPPADNVS